LSKEILKTLKAEKNFLYRIGIIGVIIFIINTFFYQICFVNGKSMEPTLKSGQMLFIKKYQLNLQNNDIIVVKKNNSIIIKRLIGLPNDTIKIDDYVYVNGNKNDDRLTTQKGIVENEIRLKDDEYFVLGDNRGYSIDSRSNEIGIIHKNEIIGKVMNAMKEGKNNEKR